MAALLLIACSPIRPASLTVQTAVPIEATIAPPPRVTTAPAEAPEEKQVPAHDRPDTGGPAHALPFDSPAGLAAYDLATRLGMATEDVVILKIQEMELPASGLGCPPTAGATDTGADEPAVLGQEIVLAAAGREYIYHASGWDVVLCSPEAEYSDLSLPPRQGAQGAPTEAARSALAEKLGMALDSITVRSAEAVEWPDASLGCPEPGMMYAQVVTPGYLILLEASGEVYEVHSDAQSLVVCDRTSQPE